MPDWFPRGEKGDAWYVGYSRPRNKTGSSAKIPVKVNKNGIRLLPDLSKKSLDSLRTGEILVFLNGGFYMAIPKDKKRYNLTLTPANVERYQSLCSQFGLPPSSMSLLCDMAIKEYADSLQELSDKGTLSNYSIFRLLAESKK